MSPPAADARSDEDLMLAYSAGDARAFDTLYQRHRGWLYRTLSRQLGDSGRADDVFQDTWYALIRSAGNYEPRARFTTWLYLLARQRLVDHWRRHDPAEQPLTFNDDGEPGDDDVLAALVDERADPARDAQRRELAARLVAAIGELPAPQREALLLAEEADMSLDEIAVATGSDREAVKSRLRYARAKLARALTEFRE